MPEIPHIGLEPGSRHLRHGRQRKWAPRLWLGCSAASWWSLLRRHAFAIEWTSPYLALVALADTLITPVNSVLGVVERVVHAKPIARTTIAPPLFVIGHWRTGTTLLHDLLAADPRHAAPTVYECLAPHHFLVTDRILPSLLAPLLPGRRPMDDMTIRMSSAFEDEFALCLLGARSPYEAIAFPRTAPLHLEQFDLDRMPPSESARWRQLLLHFFRKVSLRHPGRRLVLKSPPHTCRIRVLLQMFPGAQFVHIVRNPYHVFASTMHLWRTLFRAHGLQTPDGEGLEEAVLANFEYLYACLERDRPLVPARQFHELRYEDLVEDPVAEMRRLYDALRLPGFDAVAPSVQAYFSGRPDYSVNRYRITEREEDVISSRWHHVIERYAYDASSPSSAASSPASD